MTPTPNLPRPTIRLAPHRVPPEIREALLQWIRALASLPTRQPPGLVATWSQTPPSTSPWTRNLSTPEQLLNRLTELRMPLPSWEASLPPAQPMELRAATPVLLRSQPVVTALLAP